MQVHYNTFLAGILSKTGTAPGNYTKIRIDQGILPRILTSAGFAIGYSAGVDGIIIVMARMES